MNVLENIKQQLQEFEEKKNQIVEQLRQEFPQILAPLFEKTDKIISIGWTQYTPYFNDGDSCEFSVRNSDLIINGDYNDPSWYDWRVPYYVKEGEYVNEVRNNTEWDQVACMTVDAFKDILQSIPEDFYLELFGDHVRVTCDRYGEIIVEGYEHD